MKSSDYGVLALLICSLVGLVLITWSLVKIQLEFMAYLRMLVARLRLFLVLYVMGKIAAWCLGVFVSVLVIQNRDLVNVTNQPMENRIMVGVLVGWGCTLFVTTLYEAAAMCLVRNLYLETHSQIEVVPHSEHV